MSNLSSSKVCNELGIVTALKPENRVLVRIGRAEACHSCASKGACTTLGGQTQDVFLEVENTLNVTVGDQVALTLSESSVLKASAVLYLMPALMLMAGAFVGVFLAQRFGWNKDSTALAGTGVGLVLGLLTSRLISNKLGKQASFIPQLTSVIGNGSES